MKAQEYIEKLQGNELFPFSDQERIQAIQLAKTYTGSIVLEHWVRWKAECDSGFIDFSSKLPGIIREAESKRLQESKSEPVEKKAAPIQEDLPEIPKGSLVQDMMKKVKERRLSRSNDGEVIEKVETKFPGIMDPVEGWMIGKVPVF